MSFSYLRIAWLLVEIERPVITRLQWPPDGYDEHGDDAKCRDECNAHPIYQKRLLVFSEAREKGNHGTFRDIKRYDKRDDARD